MENMVAGCPHHCGKLLRTHHFLHFTTETYMADLTNAPMQQPEGCLSGFESHSSLFS